MHSSESKRDNKRDAEYQRAKTFNGLTAREWTLLSRNVWNDVSSPRHERHLKHGAVFPVKLADRLIRIYSKEGDHVVDPFVGIGSTCVAALRAGRRSSGIELSDEFYGAAEEWLQDECVQQKPDEQLKPRIYRGDALDLVKANFENVQLTVTSPPYANFINRSVEDRRKTHKTSKIRIDNNSRVRVYSNDPRDLGNLNYLPFLRACRRVLRDLLDVTRPGGYACWIVKDYRLPPDHPYLPMHSDLARLAQRIGWKWHDLVVWDQNEQRSLVLLGYPSRFYTNQNCSFIVILRKPD